ncbi:MAG TPA: alpha-amylase family glycosyl hydrolase, partial [Bacteroidota bacterium]
RNSADTLLAPVVNGVYRLPVTLREGANVFVALADSSGVTVRSDPPVTLTYIVDHTPHAALGFADLGTSLQIFATGSTDPDSGQAPLLTYTWSEDPANPSSLGIAGAAGSSLNAPKPQKPGLYAFGLIASDPDGNADTTRNYFVVNADRSITVPSYASNPPWVQTGRIYFLFPKEVSPQGTLNAAALRLPYIRDMGFSIIWLMPVMKNADPINLGGGPGYNITDFSTVAPEYGTNQDLKAFVDQAHALGLKVILDITPNHSSSSHPWSVDAHRYREDSRYWSWYEHTLIPHDTHGLGQSADAAGFVHYDGWDVLLDLNWSDIDLRTEMINVFKYWITMTGVDGYRFDVYWGPSLRYGEGAFGKPIREALKHVKPDILLLGETDGTGPGTERYYADYTGGIPGGVDAAYDWSHFPLISGFAFTPTAVNNLHAGLDNNGYYPGPNALFLRYMENQDEDRIAWVYSNNGTLDATTTFRRTMVMASILFTAPGLPELWNGQEVGFGYGITSGVDARRRGLIDWNFQGKSLLTPHYQKLATLRGQFPAFSQHKQDTDHNGVIDSRDASDFVRVSSTDPNLYAFLRP